MNIMNVDISRREFCKIKSLWWSHRIIRLFSLTLLLIYFCHFKSDYHHFLAFWPRSSVKVITRKSQRANEYFYEKMFTTYITKKLICKKFKNAEKGQKLHRKKVWKTNSSQKKKGHLLTNMWKRCLTSTHTKRNKLKLHWDIISHI